VRAHRQGEKASGVGFDWPDIGGVLSKVDEEVAELKEAIASGDRQEMEAELGDVLLSLASVGRHLQTPAEDALRGAVGRFDRRFRTMEAAAVEGGRSLQGLDADTLEAMWQEAKDLLAASTDRSH
jgi:ATP diphosphatase